MKETLQSLFLSLELTQILLIVDAVISLTVALAIMITIPSSAYSHTREIGAGILALNIALMAVFGMVGFPMMWIVFVANMLVFVAPVSILYNHHFKNKPKKSFNLK